MRESVHGQIWLTPSEGVIAGEVPRGEKMLLFGTDPESFITEYTFAYEESMANIE